MQLDADVGVPLIRKAQEQNRDDRIFIQWAAQLPVMAYTGKSVSFPDYKARVTGANIDRRSVAEINADIDSAELELQKGGANNGP